MSIFGDINLLKENQLVGIYSQQYDIWIVGRTKDVDQSKITVLGDLPGSIYEFTRTGDLVSPRHMSGSYRLVYVNRIPGHIRFGDPSSIKNFIADTYADHLLCLGFLNEEKS